MLPFLHFKKNIDSLLAAAVGFYIIFLFTRHGGIGIEPDSIVYFTAAENLHTHGIFTDFMNRPVVDFPAFYPFFLSGILLFTGLKPILFAPVTNALMFALVIYLSGCIMECFSFRSKCYKIAVLTGIVLSPCLLEVYSMLWSETLFILLLLLFMMALCSYYRSHSKKVLIIAALIAALASVTRYAGITIIATGGLLILLDMQLHIRKKITDLLLYSLISVSLLVINLARNYAISKTMTGNREKSITTLSKNLYDSGSVLHDWFPVLHSHNSGAGLLAVFALIGLAWICLGPYTRNHRLTTYEDIAAVFSVIYILFIVTMASISRFESLNSRLFTPVFIPLVWIGSSQIGLLYRNPNKIKKKWVAVLCAIGFFCFLYCELAADYETWDGVKDAGIPGYTEDPWRYSETVQFIQKDSLPFQQGYTIYSNAIDALYFFTKKAGKFLPHKEINLEVQDFINDHHCYVVMFSDGDNPDLVGVDFIVNIKKMKLLKQFSDGAIYGVDK